MPQHTLPLVLVVDDDPALQRILSEILRSHGYEVRVVSNGIEAISEIQGNCPDFLITDWEMPGISGPELCRVIRRMDLPHYVYTVLLTARSRVEEQIEGLQAGADDFISKTNIHTTLPVRLQSGRRIQELERRLRLAARTDAATGLLTRHAFYEQVQRELDWARRTSSALACVLIDLDFFKLVNDTYGHMVGDQALRIVAERIQSNCRDADLACRYGGEEFCVVLREANEGTAKIWAERVRRTIAETVISTSAGPLRLTGSAGVAELFDDIANPEHLVDLADQALLLAKQMGRNQVIRFSEIHNVRKQLSQVSIVRRAFADVTAADVMSPMVSCLREDETVSEAADFFTRYRINSAPVVDPAGKMVGILSEKDVLVLMTRTDRWEVPVREAMKQHVVSFDAGSSAETIFNFLCRVTIRRVIVVRDQIPIGTISRGSLLRWYANWRQGAAFPTAREGSALLEPMVARSRQLAAAAQRLETALATEEASKRLLPMVLTSVSDIQETINDLLADSQGLSG